jgi:transcription initiation factor TFIIF subunit beta
MAKKYRKDNATQRMDRDRLIPLLHEAFAEFKVWGIKTLNERVRQPESYLKEVLLSMAVLHARGDFNGKWELSDEYRASNADAFAEFESVKQGAVAPEALEASDAGEDVDDVEDGVFVPALPE